MARPLRPTIRTTSYRRDDRPVLVRLVDDGVELRRGYEHRWHKITWEQAWLLAGENSETLRGRPPLPFDHRKGD